MSQRSLYQTFSSSGTLLYHHINNTYENFINLLRKSQFNIEQPVEPNCKQKISFFQTAFKKILSESFGCEEKDENLMEVKKCMDCIHYELNLQKLQNNIREHIRLQQQLKIQNENSETIVFDLKKKLTQSQKQLQIQKNTFKLNDNIVNQWQQQKRRILKQKHQLQHINKTLKQQLQVIRKVNQTQLYKINQNLMSLHHKKSQNLKLSQNKQNFYSTSSKSSFQIDKKFKDKMRISINGNNKKGISINSKLVNSKTQKLFQSKMTMKK